MRRVVAGVFAAVVLLAGCGAEEVPVMPEVVGLQLDVALSDIERAGISDEPEVLGGGLLGVVNKANWQVCEQEPAPGQTAGEAAPRLTVARSCSEPDDQAAEPATSTPLSEDASPSAAPETPAAEPSEPETMTPSATPTASETSEPSSEEPATAPLTPETSEAFAALLGTARGDLDAHRAFALAHEGETIAFDGTVAFVMPHGDYTTRFDFLIYPGDYEGDQTRGPGFVYIDESYFGFKFQGDDSPDSVGQGDNLHFIAKVGGFMEDGEVIELEPVETRTR